MALNTGGSLYWKTKIDNTGLQTGSTQAKGILRGLTRSITGMDVFAGLAIGAALVFSKITKMAYNFAKDFEHAMREVMTISDATKRNFKGISDEIVKMSKTVPDTAIKLSKAFYQIVSAGYDGAKAMGILKISADLAVAGITDTEVAADAITYVMNSFGKAAGNAENIAGKLFMTVKLGKVKMEELAPAVSKVAGMWAQAGGSFLDLMASIATGVKSLPVDIMTTAIRGILAAIISPTEDAKKVINELGIEFDATTLATKGFSYILLEMKKAVGDDVDKMEKLAAIFPNIRGLIGALALDTEKYTGALEAMSKGTEEFNEATKIMITDTTNQLAILKNNIMAKLKPLGDSILKTMNDMASGINRAMSGVRDEFSNLARSYSELTDTLKRKQNRIDDLIATIEVLESKTELTKNETIELKAAEEALMILLPDLGKAIRDAAGDFDIITEAKRISYELSLKIMELELRQAEINKRRADLELEIYKRGEDEANKEIKRMQDRKDRFHKELSIKQIIEKRDTGFVREYIELENELNNAVEDRILKQKQLDLNVEKTTIELDALTKALEELRKSEGEPVIIPPKPKPPEDGKVVTILLTDEQIKTIEDNLKYMASQYRKYLSDVAQFGEEYVEEHNAQLAEEGGNYRTFLSDMLAEHKDNAKLSKIITDDIYEYNKAILTKRKEAEEEYFNYIAEAREKELQVEKDRYENLIKDLAESSEEYLKAAEKNKENEKEINLRYDKTIAEARLAIFKEGWEKQIGEEKEAYVRRLEGKLKELEAEKVIDTERVEFIRNKLQEINKIEKELAKEKKEILESYFKLYRTIEEKIVAIHKRTNELLSLTDDKYERDRLKTIEKQLIAEIKFDKARKEIDEKRTGYGEELNNKELEDFIGFLGKMKTEYSKYTDIIILLNEEIAESQRQIWENTRDEIDKTIDSLHSLASTVGNFDTELEETINNMADLIGGIADIKIDFSLGGIAGTLTGILGIINTIINLFVKHKSDIPELKKELAEITLELQKQQNILSQSIGTAKIEAIQDTIDLLKEQIAVYNEMIEAEKEAYGQFLWWTWSETDQEKIDQWLSSIESVNAEIFNLQQQYQQILTGITAETIADAIAEGFSQGLDSAQVFADTFNDMMKKAIVDAFKRTIITQYLQRWLRGFAILAEGGLTAEEIDFLAARYLELLQNAETQWETIQTILESVGIHLEDVIDAAAGVTGLTGAIAGITEETAGLLAGQFQAIRINTVEMLSHMESIIIINARIADNTEFNRYLTNLEEIKNILAQKSSSESEYLRGVGGV